MSTAESNNRDITWAAIILSFVTTNIYKSNKGKKLPLGKLSMS